VRSRPSDLEEIVAILDEGVLLTRELQPNFALYGMGIKSLFRARRIHPVLFSEEDTLLRSRAKAARSVPIIRAAVEYCDRYGFAITNWEDERVSRFEPPASLWRPFVPNTSFVTERPQHPLARVQRLLFDAVFSAVEGVYVFPAVGFDSEFLDRHPFISVAPHVEPPLVGDGVRLCHISKPAHDLGKSDLLEAEDLLSVQRHCPRVLVLKGLQAILTPIELGQFIAMVQPAYVVAFGTAASGFARAPVGLPTITTALEEQIEEAGYLNCTHTFFTERELALLGRIHQLLDSHFAWRPGHFPATQVRVYQRLPIHR
jgi:hypothetical protein